MTRPRLVPDTPPRAVLYLRQSVHRDDSISIELQEAAGRDYATRQGYDVVAVEADEGLSGRKWDNRPAVQRVLTMIEAHDAEVIILWKWSRLSRNRKHWALAADRVEVAGGRIESATEPIDTATASGRFARGVMTEYAAFQSEQIGEQWEEVRQRRLRLGLPASGRLPWGWEWAGDGTIRPTSDADTVQEMYRRYLAGDGSATISRWLNTHNIPAPNGGIWNRVRPFTVMDSPIHAGLIPYRGEEHPGAHKGIISPDTWQQYKAMRASRREDRTRPRERTPYLLSGLVHCHCGLRMQGKGAITSGIWYSGYICTSMDPAHGRAYISSKKIDPLIDQWFSQLADTIDDDIDEVPRIEDEGLVERLTAEWNAHQARLDKLTRLLLDDLVSEASYRATRTAVEREQAHISRRLDEARARLSRRPNLHAAELRNLGDDWAEMAPDIRRQMAVRVIRDITIAETSITITSGWGASSVLHFE